MPAPGRLRDHALSQRMRPTIAIILPPREGFSPAEVGAVGLLVRRHVQACPEFASLVLGLAQVAPFPEVDFRAVRPSWFPGNATRRYAGGVARALRAIQPDLIEVHNRPDVALFLAERFPRTPVCLFLHNDPQGMRGARSDAERDTLLARLARIVAVSAYIAGRMPLSDKVSVLPNCLDLDDIPLLPAARDKVILFAGRMVADKGADCFVAACARALPQLPGWRAEMIGADRFRADSPETDFTRALRPKAEAAGIALLGYRPHGDVLAAMARAAIVAVPSRWPEPFGLTALEALACGATLLYAPRGGLPDVAGDAGIEIDPENAESFAAALVAAAAHPAPCPARAARFGLGPVGAALATLRRNTLDAWSRTPSTPI